MINLASAIVVTSVQVDSISPGKEGKIIINIENILTKDATDVSLNLQLEGLPFIPIGSSSDGFDEIQSGDEGKLSYAIRAANDIAPGDYQIPYTINFKLNDLPETRTGTIGIKVTGKTDLSFSLDTENPIVGTEGKLNLKIINTGFADAKFVKIKLLPSSYTLLSEKEIYIGTVSSDDFETATFNVIFNKLNPSFSAIVEYKDFDNNQYTQAINLPVKIYTKDKAIELGIIKKNNTLTYIFYFIILVVLLLIWRTIKKRRRMKKSMSRR